MYFPREVVHGLFVALKARFPGASLVFDTMPVAAVRASGRPSGSGWQPPAWQWGWDADEERALARIAPLTRLPLRPGGGIVSGFALPLLTRTPGVWRGLPAILRADFV